jgi:Uma2 family endonuclease
MSLQTKKYITPEEYLAAERAAEFKSEYYQGEVFALAGAGNNHNIITINLVGNLFNLLRGKSCQVYSNDMRLHIPVNGLYTYPDVMVVCGEKQFLDEKQDTLLNPILIIEVLSPSTEDYDLGKKFMLYRSIPALQHYIVVDSRSPYVGQHSKNNEGNWVLTEVKDLSISFTLTNLDITIPLTDLYEGIDDILTA